MEKALQTEQRIKRSKGCFFPWNSLLFSYGVQNDYQSASIFGTSIFVINILGSLFLSWVEEMGLNLKPVHLLWFLFLAKNYSYEIICATYFGVDKKTFHKYAYAVLGVLYTRLDFVCKSFLAHILSSVILYLILILLALCLSLSFFNLFYFECFSLLLNLTFYFPSPFYL
jgi:hypothetical protein